MKIKLLTVAIVLMWITAEMLKAYSIKKKRDDQEAYREAMAAVSRIIGSMAVANSLKSIQEMSEKAKPQVEIHDEPITTPPSQQEH